MSAVPRTITRTLARRLAITRQQLAGPRPTPDAEGILRLVQELGCLQLDPISAVARSHLLVLWSRLGQYDAAHLDTLLWQDRTLFEYFAHCASIVPASDFPLHQLRMHAHRDSTSPAAQRTHAWLAENDTLRRHILAELTEHGPLGSKHFEDKSTTGWYSSGWTSGRNVSQLLDVLWTQGIITVAGRQGQQRLWDLTERCLPQWTQQPPLPAREVSRIAIQRSLRALGVATDMHIKHHFMRGRYPDFPNVLRDLQADGMITPVRIADEGREMPGTWFVHSADLPLLDRLEAGAWEPRTTLLSPFDNVICDRARTETLFDFDFRIEIYVPPALRKYGYYVLPILHGDQIIGRIDSQVDRKRHTLVINAMYAEPSAPRSTSTARAVFAAIQNLARFTGATDIQFPVEMPWRVPVRARTGASVG